MYKNIIIFKSVTNIPRGYWLLRMPVIKFLNENSNFQQCRFKC